MEGFQNIGQRIVEVARLAVAAHLYESMARPLAECETYRADRSTTTLRSRSATGGAGHRAIDAESDESPSSSSKLDHLVSDDEREGLMGVATSHNEARESSD